MYKPWREMPVNFHNCGEYSVISCKFVNTNGKDKAIPLQSWTDPEVSRRWRLPDFKTIGT
jgi:hypothetical protein